MFNLHLKNAFLCIQFIWLFSVCTTQTNKRFPPIVLWHGMGDSCCNPISLGAVKTMLQNELDGVYIFSLKIGTTWYDDIYNSFFMNVNKQVELACELLANDTNLSQGYNAIGFSQGGQFLRAVAQRCPNPPMLNLISIGGQHQGVYGFPKCTFSHTVCEIITDLLDHGAYTSYVQNSLVQAQYWHDPLNETEYKEKSIFLADINNEKKINEKYKSNLAKLRKFVMVKFLKDTMVIPAESEWFGFYKPGQDVVVLPYNQTALYTNDRLGLKRMDQDGKLVFLSVNADHLRISDQWIKQNLIQYLNY